MAILCWAAKNSLRVAEADHRRGGWAIGSQDAAQHLGQARELVQRIPRQEGHRVNLPCSRGQERAGCFVAVFGSGIRDPGSGMGKNQDSGSGINIPDPQHWKNVQEGSGSVINWPPGSGFADQDSGSGSADQDYGSPDPDPKISLQIHDTAFKSLLSFSKDIPVCM